MLSIAPAPPRKKLRVRNATMRAACFHRDGTFRLRTIPQPVLAAHQVRIRVIGFGLSLWDFKDWKRSLAATPSSSLIRDPLAAAPPAEGWGIVEAVGRNVTHVHPGDTAAFTTSRGFAEYAIASADAVLPLPPTLHHTPFLLHSFTGTLNLFRRSCINPGETVTIVGAGFLGLLTAQLAALAEARVIVVARRKTARQQALCVGAHHALPFDATTPHRLSGVTNGQLSDLVIECGGTATTLQLASELVRTRGRLLIAGSHTKPRLVNLPLWSKRGLDIINVADPTPRLQQESLRETIGTIDSGLLTPGPLYTHRYTLDQLGDALLTASRKPEGFIKAIVQP